METMEWDIRKMEAELQQWGVRLDKLVAKVDGFRTDGKLDYRSRLDNLSEKYAAAEARLTELKTAGTPSGTPTKAASKTPGPSWRRRSRGCPTSAAGGQADDHGAQSGGAP